MKLKPCPFCGGKDIQADSNTLFCADCGVLTHKEAWNSRAESDLAAETLKWKMTDEALRSSCDEVAKLKRENTDLLAALKRLHDSDPNASKCTEDELVDAANYDGDPVVREQAAAFLQARAAIAGYEK